MKYITDFETINSLINLAPKITDRLSEQNYKGSENVIAFNLTSWDIMTMNRNSFPMPGHQVIYFGNCVTKKDVEKRILEQLLAKEVIAKALILDSKRAGSQEMSFRRTNSGIAGSIAHKVSNRTMFTENGVSLTVDQQAKNLATWLDLEELDYAASVWSNIDYTSTSWK